MTKRVREREKKSERNGEREKEVKEERLLQIMTKTTAREQHREKSKKLYTAREK